MNDLRFALRSLIKTPGFSLAVVITLAVGIGCASAIFSVVDRILFRPPPYPHAEQLYEIGFKTARLDFQYFVSPLEYTTYRERSGLFACLPAFSSTQVNLVRQGEPTGITAGSVTLDYFGNFGVTAELGRTFVPGEDAPGADRVVVLSHRLWRDRFGSDREVLGRDVLLGGESYRVVGVLPADAAVPNGADTYQPLRVVADPARPFGGGASRSVRVIGRLRDGVTPERAIAELSAIKYDVSANYARTFADRRPQLHAVLDQYRSGGRQAQWMLLASVGFLYAIACTNTVNLLLARIHGRRRELSVRLAIGCSRARLAALIATESLLLTLGAGLLGLVVARWVFPVLLWLASRGGVNAVESSSLNWRVLAFTIALSVLTGVVISLAPALRIARAELTSGLKDGGQALGESRSLRRFRSVLIIIEAGLAVVLLVGAGLMARTVYRLQHFDRGIDPSNKAAVSLIIPARSVSGPDANRSLFLQINDKLLAVPGIQAVSIASAVPLSQFNNATSIHKADGTDHFVGFNIVSPGYRSMLGLPMVRGRWFDDARPGDASVVVLNESLAKLLFGDSDPIGQPFTLDPRMKMTPCQVIGIARDIRESPRGKTQPLFYLPDTQPPPWNSPRTFVAVLLRLGKPVDAAMADGIRRAIYAVDPLIATMPLDSLSETVTQRMSRERYALTVLKVLSLLALGLSIMGLFAVMAYSVAQRMGEFGVRVALGAMPSQLFRLVLVRGTALVASGIAIGSGAAWGLTRLIRSLLFETSPSEPLVYGAVGVVLLAAALLGCWLPARRAMHVDVVTLLRSE